MRGRDTRRWRVVRQQAYRRDMERDARCWICGGRIDYAAPSGTPDAWEPDHFLPVSTHPELAEEITNLRPSHRSCNLSRGTSMVVEGVGKPSRDWGL